jgi:Protein kinase domain
MAPRIYPTKSDYATAINNPQVAFRKKDPNTKVETDIDSILVNGEAFKIPHPANPNIKQPWSASGGFACVFKYQTFSPKKIWAVRCFNQSTSTFDSHYKKVSQRLKNIPCADYFIDFTFLDQGIRVNGQIYPIVRMEWVEGKDLKTFIKDNIKNKNRLLELAESWLQLSEQLYNAGIAHGDLQHGNILIYEQNGKINIKLIDYDSLYFAQDGNHIDDEIKGILGYQHPLRDSLQKQCLEIDFFSQWVIWISIIALAEEPTLWQTYNLDNTERLLFARNDFDNPHQAQVFDDLSVLSSDVADIFRKICQVKSIQDIPCLAIALKPDDPIDITDIFIKIAPPPPPVNPPPPGGSSQTIDTTSIFTGSSQKSGGNQSQNNSLSQSIDTTNIFTGYSQKTGGSQPYNLNLSIQKLQNENQALIQKLDDAETQLSQQYQKLNILKKIAISSTIISTIIATALAGLSFIQYQERNQLIRQIEQIRRQNNLSPGQWDLSSYSLDRELENLGNMVEDEKPLVSDDLDELINKMQENTETNINQREQRISNLEATKADLENQNQSLQNRINELENQNNSRQNRINELVNQNQSLQNRINELVNQNQSLQNRIKALEEGTAPPPGN